MDGREHEGRLEECVCAAGPLDITVGFATLDDLKTIAAEPFDAFPVHPTSLAVYHLGNSETARTQIKAWPLTK